MGLISRLISSEEISVSDWIKRAEKVKDKGVHSRTRKEAEKYYQKANDILKLALNQYPENTSLKKEKEKLIYSKKTCFGYKIKD